MIFNSEEENKDMEAVIIADAIRCSMSIPLFFKPHGRYIKYNGERIQVSGEEYVDGGLIKNYPLKLYDLLSYQPWQLTKQQEAYAWANSTTLGLRLTALKDEEVVEEEKEVKTTKNVKDILKRMIGVYMGSERLNRSLEGEYSRTIEVDIRIPAKDKQGVEKLKAVKTTQFDLTGEQQQALIENGKRAVKEFMSTSSKKIDIKFDEEDDEGKVNNLGF